MNKNIYIILVNYNGSKDTIECIKSLNLIKYDKYEIIVVDNNSSEEDKKNLKEFCYSNSKVKLVFSSENLGFSEGNNLGIKIALKENADYVLLLNNDTIVEPEFLNELLKVADNKSVLTSTILYFNQKNKIWYAGGASSFSLGRSWHKFINKSISKAYFEKNIINGKTKDVTFVSGCCMLIPKNCFEVVGFLSSKYFLYYEDTDFCFKLRKSKIKMRYVPQSIIYHNVSSSSGNNSPLMNYYKLRNRIYIIQNYTNLYTKSLAYILFYIEIIIGFLTKKYQKKVIIKALDDAKNKVYGRSIINFKKLIEESK